LFNVVYSQDNMLFTPKFVIFCSVISQGKVALDSWGGNETIFRWHIDLLLTIPKIIVIGHLLLKLL